MEFLEGELPLLFFKSKYQSSLADSLIPDAVALMGAVGNGVKYVAKSGPLFTIGTVPISMPSIATSDQRTVIFVV